MSAVKGNFYCLIISPEMNIVYSLARFKKLLTTPGADVCYPTEHFTISEPENAAINISKVVESVKSLDFCCSNDMFGQVLAVYIFSELQKPGRSNTILFYRCSLMRVRLTVGSAIPRSQAKYIVGTTRKV